MTTRMRHVCSVVLAGSVAAAAQTAAQDTSAVITTHTSRAGDLVLSYTVQVGRLPIRPMDAEEPHGYMFYVAYGTWRASGVTEILEKNGIRVAGTILQSGGVQLGADALPRELRIAHRTPGRAATAFHHGKLSPDVGRTLDDVRKSSEKWALDTYAPALARIASLTDTEREDIARQIAKYTGYPGEKIDRKTLDFSPVAFLNDGLLEDKNINNYDGRQVNPAPSGGGGAAGVPPTPVIAPTSDSVQLHYLRNDLGYRTDLAYLGTERGYMPTPGPAFTGAGPWQYNSGKVTPGVMAAAQAGEGPPGTDAWIKRAMEINPRLKVMVAVGLYDSLNSCSGNIDVVTRFPELSGGMSR